jgi:hypothetical protein
MTMQPDLAGQLKVITEWASRLRAAGVGHLAIGEISLSLLPPEPVAPMASEATPPIGILEDTETYGLPDGAVVPGFTRPNDL